MSESFYADREQTQVKHTTLGRYLSAAVPIVGSWARDIAYIDCLAGPWNQVSETLEDTSFHVAVSTLLKAKAELAARDRSPSMRCLLIDNEPRAFERLSGYAKKVKGIEVTARRWDFTRKVPDIVSYVRERPGCFPFVFIDPTGWELAAIPLITPLLQLEPGEVVINLMTSWIRRFLADESKNFAGLLGSEVSRLRMLSGEEQEEELVRCYAESVRAAGRFAYICSMPIMKPDQDAFHFHLIYATRHPKGVEEFKRTEKFASTFMHGVRAEAQQRRTFKRTGQLALLPPQEVYKESRFTRYAEQNLASALRAGETLLSRKKLVSYDDLWAEWMQYAAVQESDLREWIQGRVQDGQVMVHGAKGSGTPMKRGKGTRVEWRSQ